MPSVKERTSEFFATVESLKARAGPIEHTKLLHEMDRTEFTKAASVIGKDISSTMNKLSRLTQLAKKKSLFDDKPTEINDLITSIKQDIAKINRSIGQLTDYLNKQNMNAQAKQHNSQVINSLQSKLATTSNDFKTVLQVRSQTLKEQKSRKDQYSFGESSSVISDSPLYHPERRTGYSAQDSTDHIIDFGEQSLVTANTEYIESRSQAIESIESTIAELGQIYQNFATILAGQREMVQRIDENVLDMSMNVEGAHQQLIKYYSNMSNNRALMLKVFGVILVFFLIFVLVT